MEETRSVLVWNKLESFVLPGKKSKVLSQFYQQTSKIKLAKPAEKSTIQGAGSSLQASAALRSCGAWWHDRRGATEKKWAPPRKETVSIRNRDEKKGTKF